MSFLRPALPPALYNTLAVLTPIGNNLLSYLSYSTLFIAKLCKFLYIVVNTLLNKFNYWFPYINPRVPYANPNNLEKN